MAATARWVPTRAEVEATNIHRLMSELGMGSVRELHAWSVENAAEFWARTVDKLGIRFRTPYTAVVDLAGGAENPVWFPGAAMNIAESCFHGSPDRPAIVDSTGRTVTYGELDALSNRVAGSLVNRGLRRGDAIAIDMTMTAESVAVYLGIVKMGGAVVSVADSFAADEIATRLRIAEARLIFTQDVIRRGPKELPMYAKVVEAGSPPAVVIPFDLGGPLHPEPELREEDVSWSDFLVEEEDFEAEIRAPADTTNILFSSGTTGEPKAIPWSHTTPIKCAADGYYHQDVQPGDVVAWPTNLGWMMGPWLIYATLVNGGTIALCHHPPQGREFGEFVRDAGVTMLGVVPSLVKAWRASGCMERLDWSKIKCFSSTGECSNAADYSFLMDLAGGRPVIEYCGGTEIGGGYIAGTLVQEARPATFSLPALGLDVVILDDQGNEAPTGELFLVPPSIGLSLSLLNADHHETYFEGVPAHPRDPMRSLRRHGDQFERLPDGYYRGLGRADDTMNLGGIKTSSAEIERVLNGLPQVLETAAVAVAPPGGGPSELVIFAVTGCSDPNELRAEMQAALKEKLNPLFKISRVVSRESLPRTASNKVMRRLLRDELLSGGGGAARSS